MIEWLSKVLKQTAGMGLPFGVKYKITIYIKDIMICRQKSTKG
jgi:hypothetical protein